MTENLSCLKVFLGGSFDPVHEGHLRTASSLREELCVPEVFLVPAARSPLKNNATADDHRLAMLQLAVSGYAGLVIDTRELQRPPPSYTADTLRELRAEYGDQQPLAWVLGSDVLADFGLWPGWRELIGLSHLIIVERHGSALPRSGDVAVWLEAHVREQPLFDSASKWNSASSLPNRLNSTPNGQVLCLSLPQHPFSSTSIRAAMVRGERPDGLPESVWHYAIKHQLYPIEVE